MKRKSQREDGEHNERGKLVKKEGMNGRNEVKKARKKEKTMNIRKEGMKE